MAQLLAGIWFEPDAEDNRGAVRRTLRLELPASSASQAATKVLIRNLSESGFMIETSAGLAVGETFQIDLPLAGMTAARVIWNRESSFGCAFLSPVSKGVVSAALLKTPIDQPVPVDNQPLSKSWSDIADDHFLEKANPKSQAAVMVSLILLSFVVILFIFALLNLPFSTEQF